MLPPTVNLQIQCPLHILPRMGRKTPWGSVVLGRSSWHGTERASPSPPPAPLRGPWVHRKRACEAGRAAGQRWPPLITLGMPALAPRSHHRHGQCQQPLVTAATRSHGTWEGQPPLATRPGASSLRATMTTLAHPTLPSLSPTVQHVCSVPHATPVASVDARKCTSGV